MKFTLLAVAAGLAGLAYAQVGGDGVPTCAQPCLTPYLSGSSIAGCSSLDITCICSNKSFISGISCCLATACSPADQQKAIDYALSLCKANKVTDLPTVVACSTTAAPTGTGSSSAATTTSKPASSTGSSVTSSAAVASTSKPAAAPRNGAGIGAGVIGGLIAAAALL